MKNGMASITSMDAPASSALLLQSYVSHTHPGLELGAAPFDVQGAVIIDSS